MAVGGQAEERLLREGHTSPIVSNWMALSILKSGLGKAKKAKEHVEEGLEKVKAKPWAEPLGKALRISGKIAGAVEGFAPRANIIGGALLFGATLLNPEPSLEDLQHELREVRNSIQAPSHQVRFPS